MSYTIAIANQKGGVGKTTLVFNLSSALAMTGARVLMVDNDPQGNLTTYASNTIPENQKTLDEVYLAKEPLRLTQDQTFCVGPGLYLIPSDPMLAGVEYYLLSKSQRDRILGQSLKNLEPDFDFILIDNPPSLNLLTINGLMASQHILVPVQAEYFSLEGISQLQTTIEDLKRWEPKLQILGFVANMFDDRRRLNSDVMRTLIEAYPQLVFETRIHDSVKITESSGFGRSILDYSPKSRSAEEFHKLAREVRQKLE